MKVNEWFEWCDKLKKKVLIEKILRLLNYP